jgi:hypothetical protein
MTTTTIETNKEHAMRIERLSKTPSGKVHGFVTYQPDEREQALAHMDRLNTIRDEQHYSRPPRARRPWTSHTLDSWDGSTLVTFGNFHELEPLQELFQ